MKRIGMEQVCPNPDLEPYPLKFFLKNFFLPTFLSFLPYHFMINLLFSFTPFHNTRVCISVNSGCAVCLDIQACRPCLS